MCPTWEYLFRSVRGLWWLLDDTFRHVASVLDVNKRWVRSLCDKELIRIAQNPMSNSIALFRSNLTIMERERAQVNQDAIFHLEYDLVLRFVVVCIFS